MKLPMFSLDKANHFVYGAVITSLITYFRDVSVGIIVCVVIALLKELYDSMHQSHRPEIKDAVATILGGLVVASPFIAK
jgi:VanZ family protein